MGHTDGGVIFVGGAPRSGTTVVHAMICTSTRVNGFVPESSFLTHCFRGLVAGLWRFDNHTSGFFTDRADFGAFARGIVAQVLDRVRDNLGNPEILALKDPWMTPLFGLLSSYYPGFKFVVTVRHPLDVYRSRREVQRLAGAPWPPSPAAVRVLAEEYVNSYPVCEGPNICHLRYEDIETDALWQELSRFVGVDDLDVARLWERSDGSRWEGVSDPTPGAWASPLYGAAIRRSTRRCGVELAPYEVETVLEVASRVMQRFGYE